jgi:hypothetical protein
VAVVVKRMGIVMMAVFIVTTAVTTIPTVSAIGWGDGTITAVRKCHKKIPFINTWRGSVITIIKPPQPIFGTGNR